MDLIIKNGTIATASDTYIADIGIKGGRIVMIGKDLESAGAEVVDARLIPASRDGEVDAGVLQHPLGVAGLDSRWFGGEHLRIEGDAGLQVLDVGVNMHVSDVKMPAGVRAVYEDNFAVVGVVAQEAEEVKTDEAPAK